MANKVVRIHPVGPGPGVRNFATTPTISPNSIQAMIDMTALFCSPVPPILAEYLFKISPSVIIIMVLKDRV